jgi:hypothetical protein
MRKKSKKKEVPALVMIFASITMGFAFHFMVLEGVAAFFYLGGLIFFWWVIKNEQ